MGNIHSTLRLALFSTMGCISWFLINFFRSDIPSQIHFYDKKLFYLTILVGLCSFGALTLHDFHRQGYQNPWSSPWKRFIFDGLTWFLPGAVLCDGLLRIDNPIGPKLFCQGAFGLANVFYYKFYDGSISDCLSQTYRKDKYGIPVSYLIIQIILQALRERSRLLQSPINSEHLSDLYFSFTLKMLKSLLLNLVFQHHTSARGEQRNSTESHAHMMFVLGCVCLELISLASDLGLKPLEGLKQILLGLCSNPHQYLSLQILNTIWADFSAPFSSYIFNPSTPLLWLWLSLFYLAQTQVDKTRKLEELKPTPLHNFSWIFELAILTTTIK